MTHIHRPSNRDLWRAVLLGALLTACSAWLLACGGPSVQTVSDAKTLSKENLSMHSWLETTLTPGRYTIWLDLRNTGKLDDVIVDVWTNVLPGMAFSAQSNQEVTEDGTQATRRGLTIRPGGSVQIPFTLVTDQSTELGTHILYTFVRFESDVLQQKLELTVTREQ